MPTYIKGSQEAKDWAKKMAEARNKKRGVKIANEPQVKIDMVGETELIIPDWYATRTKRGFKLVNPMTKERNLSVRDGRTSIKILRKPVEDAILMEGMSETIPLSSFPPKDRLMITKHFDKVKQYKDTDPKNIPSTALGELKERGRPEKLQKNIDINKKRKEEEKRKAEEEEKKVTAKKKGRPVKYATDEERKTAIKAQKKRSDDARYLRNKAKKAEISGGSITAGDLRKLLDASYDGRDKVAGYELDKDLSTSTSKVYVNPETEQVIVGHMGTEGILDWGNNAIYALGGKSAYKKTARYKEAEKVQKKAEKKYGAENVSTIGHSQGGLQAELLGKKSKETITLNKATIPFQNQRNKNQTDIRTSGDIVSSLNPFQSRGENDILIKGKTYNPLDIHSSKSLRGLDKNVIIGKGGGQSSEETATAKRIAMEKRRYSMFLHLTQKYPLKRISPTEITDAIEEEDKINLKKIRQKPQKEAEKQKKKAEKDDLDRIDEREQKDKAFQSKRAVKDGGIRQPERVDSDGRKNNIPYQLNKMGRKMGKKITGNGKNLISTDNIKMRIDRIDRSVGMGVAGCGIDGNGCCRMCGGNIFKSISKSVSKGVKDVGKTISKEVVKPATNIVNNKDGVAEDYGKKLAGFSLRTAVPALAGLAVGSLGSVAGANPIVGTLAGATASKATAVGTDKLATKWGVGLTAGMGLKAGMGMKPKRRSDWIDFVKKVQQDKGVSYKEAMTLASKMRRT